MTKTYWAKRDNRFDVYPKDNEPEFLVQVEMRGGFAYITRDGHKLCEVPILLREA